MSITTDGRPHRSGRGAVLLRWARVRPVTVAIISLTLLVSLSGFLL